MWFCSRCHVRSFATPWTAAHYASLSFIIFQSLLKLMSIKLVMPSRFLYFQISIYGHNSFSFLWLQTLNPIYSLIWLFKLTNEISVGFSSPLSTSKLQICYKVSFAVHLLPPKTMSFLCLLSEFRVLLTCVRNAAQRLLGFTDLYYIQEIWYTLIKSAPLILQPSNQTLMFSFI